MKDTDWRPSPCPGCGEMREAAKNPVCTNKECVLSDTRTESGGKQQMGVVLVQMYRTPDGMVHETLQDAVCHELVSAFSNDYSGDKALENFLHDLAHSPKMRSVVLKLLQQ